MKGKISATCLQTLLTLSMFGALTACGGSDSNDSVPGTTDTTACTGTTPGSLVVNIDDSLIPNRDAMVLVYGPEGYVGAYTPDGTTTSMASGTAMTDLVSGLYTFTVEPVIAEATGSDAIVRKAYRGSMDANSVCVGDGNVATVTLSYSLVPTSNLLWIGSSNSGYAGANNMTSYSSSSLVTSATVTANSTNTTIGHSGVAFDRDGNLWVLGQTTVDPLIARYPAEAFSSGGEKVSDFSIPRDAIPDAIPISNSAAFDPTGNLWISSPANGAVYRFKAAEGGVVESLPSVTITGLIDPKGLAFAHDHTLWVADSGSDTLLRFIVDSAADGDTITTPNITTDPQQDVKGIAFDHNNNLWVASHTQSQLFQLTPVSLHSGGTVTPDKTYAAGSLPVAVAVDESNHVWVAGNGGYLLVFDAASISGSAPVKTIITYTTEMNYGESLAFYPAPADLPLYHSLR